MSIVLYIKRKHYFFLTQKSDYMDTENYVYRKEVDWSLLMEGLTLPYDKESVFGQIMGRFLERGESKKILLYLNGKSYKSKMVNVNNPIEKRKKDALQIRYPRNGEFSKALQTHFYKSYNYIKSIRELRDKLDRSMIRLPEEYKEYLAIYTTEYDDSYIVEPILVDDMDVLRKTVSRRSEIYIENIFNYDTFDTTASISEGMNKIRKLNRKIGDNLKHLYNYRCQICGKVIGERYGCDIVEAHHIDYFVNSLNNNFDNQLIVCPNHHSIIHDVNPHFDRSRLMFVYDNGVEEGLSINLHL